jgi:hypothetical protein
MDPIRAHLTTQLRAHPTVPNVSLPVTVDATVTCFSNGAVECRYDLTGALDHCVFPSYAQTHQADELWQHTVFETFVAEAGQPSYREFNWSPSGGYAAYQFSDYRALAQSTDAVVPLITSTVSEAQATLIVRLRAGAWPASPLEIGLSAVIEGVDGVLHYFAAHHPLNRPDFHDRRGFVLRIG